VRGLLFNFEEACAVVVRLAFRLRRLRDQDTHDDGKYQYNNLPDPPSIVDIDSSGLVHFACGFCVLYSTKVQALEVKIFAFGAEILHPYPNLRSRGWYRQITDYQDVVKDGRMDFPESVSKNRTVSAPGAPTVENSY
jgi:hypothetical protein